MKKPNITFKSLLQPIKDIQKRNKYFDYLDDEGKRLEIAWDMLQLLVNEKLEAIGVAVAYWSSWFKTGIEELSDSKSIQKYLCEELPTCRVCARGGLMISQLRLGNSINYNYHIDSGRPEFIKGFIIEDFVHMENEYERGKYEHPYYNGSTEKLMNICCNILVNGNFNIDDKTDYLIDA